MPWILWLVLSLAATQTAAHHANSAYDRTTTTRISGAPTMSTRIVIFADGREVNVRSAPD